MSINYSALNYPQRLLVLDTINSKRLVPVIYQDILFGRCKVKNYLLHQLEKKLYLLNSGYPLDYLLKEINFLDLKISVHPGVFIPRPETEEWVQKIVETKKIESSKNFQLKTNKNQKDSFVQLQEKAKFKKKIEENVIHKSLKLQNSKFDLKPNLLVDMCSGSGVIGLSLADYYNQVVLVDFFTGSTKNAKKNIQKNFKTNVNVIKSNIFENSRLIKMIKLASSWNLVCNPPYVPTQDILKIKENNIKYEPMEAIFSGSDGLDFFRSLLLQLKQLPKPSSVWFELDPRNIRNAQTELNSIFSYTEIWLDSNGLERVLVGKN